MKILLIAPHFFPDEHIGASRWNRLSRYLQREGHEIYVITSNILSDSTKSPRATKLLRVDYKASPMDQILSGLRKKKKSWSFEVKRQSSLKGVGSGHTSLYDKAIRHIGKYLRFPGIYWWSSRETVKKGLEVVKSEKIDMIIGTFPFSVSISSAYQISKRSKTPWIADMRDGWSSYYFGEYKKGTILHFLLKKIERFYLMSATCVVTINRTLAASLCVSDKKITVIPNVFDPEEKINLESPLEQICSKIVFSFAGSVHDDHCWEIFFEGLSHVEKSSTGYDIEINYFGNYFGKVLEKWNQHVLPENILSDRGYVEKDNLMVELSKADFLLVFGFKGAHGDSVTTGKIFDYIELGKPVIVFGPKTSELAKLVIKTGIGIVISDYEEAETVILEILQNKDEFKNRIRKKIDSGEILEYSARKAAKCYSDLITRLLKN